MDRTLIAWNVPNLITIPLMAFLGFLVVSVIWQLVVQMNGGQTANNSGGY